MNSERVSGAPYGFGFGEFFLSHKGDLTLAFSALVYVGSWLVLIFTRWTRSAEIVVSIA